MNVSNFPHQESFSFPANTSAASVPPGQPLYATTFF